MVKTLRITTVLIALAALGFIIFIAAKGVASDKDVEKFLAAPGIAEQLQTNSGVKSTDVEQDTPLIRQAKALALRINPPPPPMPVAPPQEEVVRPKATITAKFTLVGTSYYPGDEKNSWALINEVGKGWHWVKEGESIGYLAIEKIGDGAVLIRDGNKTYELTAERQQKPDFVKSFTGTEPNKTIPSWQGKESAVTEAASTDGTGVSSTENAQSVATEAPKATKEDVEENIKWLKQIQKQPESIGMTAEEANELGDLGEVIKSLETEIQTAESNEPNVVRKPSLPRPKDANEKQVPQAGRQDRKQQQDQNSPEPRELRRIRRK